LEGAAVTSVRIEGITHEYTSIPGVVEDVIDIMLNLKSVVVKTDSYEPQHLRLDATKPGPVLAGDIELPAGVKIVNPDCVVCTLSQGGSIHADITVEVGKGYVATDVLKEQKNGLPIDLLPIDAVFMPIRRVAYNVESARVGESLDYDKLTLEIWSNGSIEVGAALSKASNLLIEHFSQIAGISGTPVQAKPEIIEEEVTQEVAAPTLSIEDLELSVRAYNCLKRASINSMSELGKKSEHYLFNMKNFGKKTSDEVIEKLHQMGLDLQPNPENIDDLELI
ncbi:DNA-directed RNA polymerase subunit alpha, partial [bacterium]|nr:DNA-directed RNA polymerase subunit alpha [bacterium]